jgi:ATP-dependent exoDNAse (exonuclease V) beta subunit
VANSPLAHLFDEFNWRERKEVDAVVRSVQLWVMEQGLPRTLDLLADEILPHCSRRDARRLEQLVELAHEFSSPSVTRFGGFIDFVSVRKVEDTMQTAVRVMTVHQSKGLEFDAVFLPELDGALDRSFRSRTLTYRDSPMSAPSRVSMYPRSAIRALDPRLGEMHAQGQSGGVQEELSVLYVALTRARQALYLFVDRPKDPTRYSATAAGFIRASLGDALQEEGGDVAFQIGDPDWFKMKPLTRGIGQEMEEPLSPVLEFTTGLQRRRGLPRKAPSSEEGGGLDIIDILTRDSTCGVQAASRGTMLHLLFEQIGWIEEFQIDESALTTLLQERGAASHDAKLCVEEFQQMIQKDGVREFLLKSKFTVSQESELTVEQELPFAVREGDTLITGVIDRLVLSWREGQIQQAHIIDFKSDQLSSEANASDWLREKENFYLPQLSGYAAAVQSLYGIEKDRVSATLLFVTEGVATQVQV